MLPNHLTFGPHGLSTATQKADFTIVSWNLEFPAFPRGQEFKASRVPSLCSFLVGYLPKEVTYNSLGGSALLVDICFSPEAVSSHLGESPLGVSLWWKKRNECQGLASDSYRSEDTGHRRS